MNQNEFFIENNLLRVGVAAVNNCFTIILLRVFIVYVTECMTSYSVLLDTNFPVANITCFVIITKTIRRSGNILLFDISNSQLPNR